MNETQQLIVEDRPYAMVEDRLFIGPVPVRAADPRFKRIVNLYPWEPYQTEPDVITLSAFIFDGPAIPVNAEVIADQVNYWRFIQSKDVFVHCQMGWNRSGLVCALALIRSGEATPEQAIAKVRSARGPGALSNPHFVEFLTNGG